jgi:urate oxidase
MRRHFVFDGHGLDMRSRRTSPQRALDAFDRFLVPLDQGLDSSVRQIANEAVHALDGGVILDEIPEPDALHPSTDEEPLRNDHGKGKIIANPRYSSAMPRLGASSQGESRLRLLRIVRRGDRHDPRDLTVSVRFEGDFATAFLDGASGGMIPGETVKSTVHRIAREHGAAEIEAFGLALCRHVFETHRHVTRVRVDVAERPWTRVELGGKAQGQSFVQGGPEQRIAAVTSNGTQVAVVAGIEQMVLMRTSGFLAGQQRGRPDDGTEDAVQSLFVGSLSARWTYTNPEVTFGPYRQGVRLAITETFAMHASRSIQYTLYAIADVVLATYEEILNITLTMQERPYRPADLFRAQVENPDEVFVAAEEPLGLVEVTVERDQAARP